MYYNVKMNMAKSVWTKNNKKTFSKCFTIMLFFLSTYRQTPVIKNKIALMQTLFC